MRVGRLTPVLRLDSGVGLDTRLKILAQPTAFYGKGVAIRGTAKARDRLQVTQRVLVRRCLGAPWFVPGRHLQKAVRDVLEVAEESGVKLVQAARNHSDEGVRAVAEVFDGR